MVIQYLNRGQLEVTLSYPAPYFNFPLLPSQYSHLPCNACIPDLPAVWLCPLVPLGYLGSTAVRPMKARTCAIDIDIRFAVGHSGLIRYWHLVDSSWWRTHSLDPQVATRWRGT